jgi:SSS family solute:Na+ symporter
MNKWGALSGMIVGGLTVIIWILSGLSTYVYEMIPGFTLSLISVIIVSLLTEKPNKAVNDEFEKMESILREM